MLSFTQYTGDIMLKKVFSIIVILMLLLPNVSAEEANPELVTNGGFESVSGGYPLGGWSGTQIDWGESVSVTVTTENVHSGTNAVKIINDGNQSPWINIQVPYLIPGAMYEVSFWLYAELKTAPQIPVGMSMEFYRGAATASGGVGSNYVVYPGSTNGRWTYVTETFMLPYEATMVKMYCRLWAEGYAFFDDVSLKLSEADKFRFSASHVFHYTDDETGETSVVLNSYYADKIPESEIYANFCIFDGETPLYEKTNVPFYNSSANFSYTVPEVLTKKGHAYKMRIEVTNTSGALLDSYEQNLYKYDRPLYLDKDGIYHDENGKEIVPVIAYHLNTEDYSKASEAGFTMAQVDYSCAPVERKAHREAVLDAADENALKAVFCLYYDMKNAAHPDIIANTKKLVEQYKDDPRIFGWLVQDEPLGAGITEEAKSLLELAYKTIRDIDPNHPVVIADYSSYVFKESVKYCDVFIPNSYGLDLGSVREYARESVKYAGGRPIYPNIGAYSRNGYTDGLPNGERLQHFVFQALLGGAKGVSVFSFSDVVTKPSKVPIYNTSLWDPLCEVLTKDFPVCYDLYVHGGETEKTETDMAVTRKWTKEDGDYYVITSLSEEEQTVTFPVGQDKGVLPLGSTDATDFSLNGDILSVKLAGGDALVFRVFSTEDTILFLKNGLPVSKLEAGRITVKTPSDT